MGRCSICGCNDCCGADLELEVEQLRAELAAQREQEPVAWALAWPEEQAAGKVNPNTVFGNPHLAQRYIEMCKPDRIKIVPLYAAAQPTPEGYALVPLKATKAMKKACDEYPGPLTGYMAWKVMVEAAMLAAQQENNNDN